MEKSPTNQGPVKHSGSSGHPPKEPEDLPLRSRAVPDHQPKAGRGMRLLYPPSSSQCCQLHTGFRQLASHQGRAAASETTHPLESVSEFPIPPCEKSLTSAPRALVSCAYVYTYMNVCVRMHVCMPVCTLGSAQRSLLNDVHPPHSRPNKDMTETLTQTCLLLPCWHLCPTCYCSCPRPSSVQKIWPHAGPRVCCLYPQDWALHTPDLGYVLGAQLSTSRTHTFLACPRILNPAFLHPLI